MLGGLLVSFGDVLQFLRDGAAQCGAFCLAEQPAHDLFIGCEQPAAAMLVIDALRGKIRFFLDVQYQQPVNFLL